MFAEERKVEILNRLEQFGKVKVNNLSKVFKVSEATIRRDLQELEENGVLKRTHGGAVFNEHTKFEPTLNEKEDKYSEEKNLIGKMAADLVKDGDTIILDAGTTTLEIAKNISAKNITVVTNSLTIANELIKRKDIDIVVIGGLMRWETHAMVGPIGDNTLKGLRVDKAFLGANGICLRNGLTTPNINEASTKRSMMDIASQVIFACDHTKFNQVSFAKIADMSEIDMIITDNNVLPSVIDKYKEKEIEIIIAN